MRGTVGRPGPAQPDGNILQDCSFVLFSYFLLALERQRKRCPFFKFCLADGYARDGRAARVSLARRKYILGLFFFIVSNTFCYHQKSKGNAGLFSNFVLRTDMRGDRSGGQGQPSQTEIYYRIVHFRLVLKNKRNACLFYKFCFADGYAGRAVGRPGPAWPDEKILQDCLFLWFQMLSLSIEKQRKRWPFFSNFESRTDMRGDRSGGQGQPSQTEIYYRIVHFYGFK